MKTQYYVYESKRIGCDIMKVLGSTSKIRQSSRVPTATSIFESSRDGRHEEARDGFLPAGKLKPA